MSKPQEEFKKQSFFRLLKYAMPYRFRLIVGIIAGFIVGGSLLSGMLMLPQLMSGIENTASTAQVIKKDEDPKLAKEVNKIRTYAEKLNLPVTVEGKNISFWKVKIPFQDDNGLMSWQFFSIYVFAFVIAWTLKNIATYVNHYYTRWVGARVIADLRNEVFSSLMGQSLKFYGKMDVGQLISRCTNDTASIESAIANTIADATRCPIEILACVAAIIIASVQSKNYALPIILFFGLPLCVLPIIILGRRIRKIYKKAYSKIAEVVTRMHEVFTGILIVKAYHMEKRETGVFKEVNRRYFRTVVSALKMELLMAPMMEIVAVTATLVFLIYSYSQKVSLSELTQLLVPAFMAYKPIKEMAKISAYLQKSMAAADRYFDLLDANTGIKEKENPITLDEFRNEISFNNVVFSYENGKKILDGIELKIAKGHVVAVVGETGSGKTTIANLIARFYDVDTGSVTIDGIDVRDMKISSLRDHIGIVTQDAILFNDTIANNIAYGCEGASIEQITKAAMQANAHQFIVDGRHEEKYETVVGEKGFKLSGGEKQRIAIARAILKNPPILILDEATSALDTVTERLVQEALNRVMENRTVFAIAHRLSTIKHANMIIVLDKGRIIESGTHDELMIKGGHYKKLHDTQFGQREDTANNNS
ncbi:MAG: hypothetical protein A2017_00880 [Lentisphaerae bacterium GWF2_44_16]|nr:MAG: hypothetical protein A2017_00880 [Lentisphaerae bacterium GWF2_44_16]